ncbi:MAG: outer membrane protein assembly factor BamA [Myxococcales bacterium]|nr:outer membrane protein assembly factor BamA [Myxococcales bacterium]
MKSSESRSHDRKPKLGKINPMIVKDTRRVSTTGLECFFGTGFVRKLIVCGLIYVVSVFAFLVLSSHLVFAVSPCFRAPVGITGLKIEGAQRSEPASIFKQIQHPKSGLLKCRIIREDIKRIFRQGFYRDVKVELTEDDNGGRQLVYRVLEKRQVRAVRYEGNDELSEEDIAEVVDVKPYTILDLPKIKRNSQKIKDLYVEKGFFLAEVSSDIIEGEDQQVDVVFRISEKKEIRVTQIQIIGNQAISDQKLKGFLETREENALSFIMGGGTFNNEAFERDQMRLLQMYYNEGYMQAVVSQPTVMISPDRSKLYITIRIEENARFKVGLTSVTGELLKSKEELLKLLNMKEGEWFSSGAIRDGMNRISEVYKNLGYAYANLVPNTRFIEDLGSIDLSLDIRKGPLVKIGRIEIIGNTNTRDKVIRREMRIAEGDTYSSKLINRSQQLINRLGFFETATIEPARSNDPNLMDLVVRVKEKPTGTFQVGAGFSSIESFVGQAQIAQNNLFGRGQSLSLQATFSSIRSMANLRLSENYFLDSRLQFSANIYRYDTNFFNFIRQSLGGNLTLGYPITDDLSIATTYTIEEVNASQGGFGVRSNSSVTPANYFNNGITSSLRLSAFYDTRNNRLFPSKGSFISASVEDATRFLGSTNEFFRYDIKHRYYFDLGYNLVLKSNINWGLITTDNRSGVPIFERYFIGGPLSVRGFFRNSLGPQLQTPIIASPSARTSAFTIGGTEQLFFNFEFEFPIFQQVGIRGVGFLDGGNAFDRQEDYLDKLEQFRFAWGFGIRWFSPIGPLRFEWGFPFNPINNEQDSVFEFSIGNFF